ncbi:leucine-rich repeat-containing protein 9-like [Diprion similis]|uniref:leucine-rich repeat-containing protein 9-like n=1 Tax=Diprion similis TaxID=362088 RepID=UPI001EF8EDED|nr:leucine-rich repeat-containing protein 9-like [Diprion similis]
MSNSTELKLLSLSGNKISHLENFNSMPKLRELYLANNRIKKIGDSFLQSPRLTVMNLAGNTLYQLQDIQNLSFLPSLQSVVFADPMYGECPLVSLSAYRYFVINYLPTLNELDHYRITSEERSYVTEFFKYPHFVDFIP